LGEISPGQEIVDLAVRMAVDDFGDDAFEVDVRFDGTQLTGGRADTASSAIRPTRTNRQKR